MNPDITAEEAAEDFLDQLLSEDFIDPETQNTYHQLLAGLLEQWYQDGWADGCNYP